MSRLIKINNKGVDFNGDGSKGLPLKLWLMESRTPYCIVVKDKISGSEVLRYDNCSTGKILYYRLKNSHILNVSNSGSGGMKVL